MLRASQLRRWSGKVQTIASTQREDNVLHTIAVHMPNLLPKWHFLRPAGRLIWSSLILIIAIGIIVTLCKRPKPVEPATWAQSMLGAVVSFALMLIAYGTVPHEWLTFANGYLKLDDSHFILKKAQWFLAFDINKSAIKDVVATLIYAVGLTTNMKLFVKWQKRPAAKAEAPSTPAADVNVGTSAYGKTVTAKA